VINASKIRDGARYSAFEEKFKDIFESQIDAKI